MLLYPSWDVMIWMNEQLHELGWIIGFRLVTNVQYSTQRRLISAVPQGSVLVLVLPDIFR